LQIAMIDCYFLSR